MILEHIELHQICQHEHLEYDLKPGLIGILGPNGAGKSNFVNMTFATLTGDFSVNPGVKDDNVRWGKPDDDYSAVTGRWQHGGETFTVRRALANTHNYLRREGKKELRGTKEITAEIESILGIPKQALNFMFVPQWEMFAFISADPATRSSTFSHLCGTAQVEKLHKQLGEEIKVYRSAADGVRDNRKEIEQRLLERSARVLELDKQLATANKNLLDPVDYEDYKAQISEAIKQRELSARLAKLLTLQDEQNQRLHKANVELRTAQRLLADAEARRAEMIDSVNIAEAELTNQGLIARQLARKETLKTVLSEKKVPVPPVPEWYDDADELKATAATLKRQIEEDTALITLVESGEVAECPTCHTPTKNLLGALPVRKKSLAHNRKYLAQVQDQLLSCSNYDAAMRVYSKDSTAQQSKKAAARAELDAMPELPQTSGKSTEELQEIVDAFNELISETTGFIRRRSNAEVAVATIRGALSRTDEEVAEILDQSSEALLPDVVADLQMIVELHEKAVPMISILEARKQDLEELNQADREELEKVTKALESTVTVRQYVADLEEARETAHRDNFPKLAAQKWLEDLTGLVNETLEDFDSPFRVETTDDLSFVAIKPDGRRERAERLSGGQKMLLALAFRFAVNRIMAADIGMMILDEPTAGVDKTNVENMTDILKRLSSYTKDQGRQILIITHDESLVRAFDQVIHIDKQN
jgi:DNA repair exonuclease SbcCD ATPase subunit